MAVDTCDVKRSILHNFCFVITCVIDELTKKLLLWRN